MPGGGGVSWLACFELALIAESQARVHRVSVVELSSWKLGECLSAFLPSASVLWQKEAALGAPGTGQAALARSSVSLPGSTLSRGACAQPRGREPQPRGPGRSRGCWRLRVQLHKELLHAEGRPHSHAALTAGWDRLCSSGAKAVSGLSLNPLKCSWEGQCGKSLGRWVDLYPNTRMQMEF